MVTVPPRGILGTSMQGGGGQDIDPLFKIIVLKEKEGGREVFFNLRYSTEIKIFPKPIRSFTINGSNIDLTVSEIYIHSVSFI